MLFAGVYAIIAASRQKRIRTQVLQIHIIDCWVLAALRVGEDQLGACEQAAFWSHVILLMFVLSFVAPVAVQ